MNFKEEMYNSFVNDFSHILEKKVHGHTFSKLIFLCIGTDRIIGDCFGPLIGYKLKNLFFGNKNVEIIGDLENIVSLSNIEKIINNIYTTYELPLLIAIDAALSNKIEIGKTMVSSSKMNVAGCFINKRILVGDISIKGIVTNDLKSFENNFNLLQNVPLNRIMYMADYVSQGICDVINV